MTETAGPADFLSPIRERSAAALEFPLSGFAEDSIRACTQSAMDVPLLLAAVEAALKLHQPHVRRQNWPPVCLYDNRRWPCPEVAAITSALSGTQPGDRPDRGAAENGP